MDDKSSETHFLSPAETKNSSEADESVDAEPEGRGNWAGKLEFFFSCLSYAVGLGNLWRFPYLCYRNGGGAFLIPYVCMLAVAGMPLFFLELSFGQFAAEGVISIWKISPLFQGIGWGMLLVSFVISIYYNVIIAWALFYLFASFRSEVAWKHCDNDWNTGECRIMGLAEEKNYTSSNGVWFNYTCFTNVSVGQQMFEYYKNKTVSLNARSPSDEYFHEYVLELSEGLHEMGGVKWEIALCLLLAWIVLALCLSKGVQSVGKAAYFTALFPYVILIILMIRGLTLPGAIDGIVFYLTPEWKRLIKAEVWVDAAVQIFFSLGPCWGGLITLASYNKFNNNCFRDALLVPLGNCFTSFFAGFVIFGVIGYIAHELGVKVGDVATQGAGLAFVIYPEVVARLPISPLWSILFFSMLITLGVGTQFTILTTIHTTLIDVLPHIFRNAKRKLFLLIAICFASFLLGLPCCSRAGMYVLQLMDSYAATYSVLVLGFLECCVLCHVYGASRFLEDIKLMLGFSPGILWKYIWGFLSPGVILFILIFTWTDFKGTSYGDYKFPVWAEVIGWCLSFASILPVPIVALYKIYTTRSRGPVWKTIKFLTRPTPEWGPADKDITYTMDDAIYSNTSLQSNSLQNEMESDL